MPRWRTWRLAEVEPGEVRDLFGQMRRDGRSTSQIRKLRAALSALFATAVDDGKRPSNPVAGVRIPNGGTEKPSEDRAKALTREELGVLLEAIPEGWRLFFEFLAHSGLRISEAVGLTWAHLELGERPHVEVREQFYRGERRRLKSGSGRRDIPLGGDGGASARPPPRRLQSPERVRLPVRGRGTLLIRGKVAQRVLNRAREAAGMEWVSFHSFRHTCASLLFDQGRNVKQVAEWLGLPTRVSPCGPTFI